MDKNSQGFVTVRGTRSPRFILRHWQARELNIASSHQGEVVLLCIAELGNLRK